MIRSLTEQHLQDATDGEIADFLHERFFNLEREAVQEMTAIVRLNPTARFQVAAFCDSGALFCNECGMASCVHGYSDE